MSSAHTDYKTCFSALTIEYCVFVKIRTGRIISGDKVAALKDTFEYWEVVMATVSRESSVCVRTR